jgi:hypothetical protein
MAQRDIYQRKAFAVRRMSLEVMRAVAPHSRPRKQKAIRWAKMCGVVSGIRQFKLGSDGAKGKAVVNVEGLDGQLKLFYLPPYAPHLKPDEQVWAHVKRRVSKQPVQANDEMKKLALGALRRIQKLPSLVKSFFQQPECQYAR